MTFVYALFVSIVAASGEGVEHINKMVRNDINMSTDINWIQPSDPKKSKRNK